MLPQNKYHRFTIYLGPTTIKGVRFFIYWHEHQKNLAMMINQSTHGYATSSDLELAIAFPLAVHLAVSFEESIHCLNNANVGDLISSDPGNQWYDPGTEILGNGLSAGDALFITATSGTTVPDVLGFNFYN